MDNQRLFTWGLVGLMFFMCWQAWQLDYNTPAPSATPPSAATPTAPPAAEDTQLPDLAGVPAAEPAAGTAAGATAESPARELIRVRTDVLDLRIDPVGGDLVEARILRYPVSKRSPDDVVQLLSRKPGEYGVYRTGLRAGDDAGEPNHLAAFHASRTNYELESGAEQLDIPLTWRRADGLSVVKRYRLKRGSYQIDLDYTVTNGSESPWAAASYAQIVRNVAIPERSMFDVDTYSFTGPVLYNGSKYEKYPIDDLDDDAPRFSAKDGWLAAIQHHFLVAAVPPADETWNYSINRSDARYVAGAIGELVTTSPGQTSTYSATLFVGPKLQSQLEEIAPKLKLTVDYGILTILAQPLFWLLAKVYDVVRNWGWAIVIVTLLIKLAFYRLTATSGRSMAKMRKLQPRLKQLQERYKDDRQKLSQAMMDLYKREKVNPAAGCLPILVQMPFFLAFYWVLLESVEMRQAPFMLWINDLSARDPYFILPLLMGAAMFFQQKLNPAPPDPVQARVMSVLPVVFTVFFAFFPAGLVLYWFTNTLLSIAQQWRINQLVEAEDKKTKK